MTSGEKMREDYETLVRKLHSGIADTSREGGGEYCSTLMEFGWMVYQAALHSVEAEKEPEWISCGDRLPEESDADCKGKVWYCSGSTLPKLVYQADFTETHQLTQNVYWMPTGLCRPAPPEHKPG